MCVSIRAHVIGDELGHKYLSGGLGSCLDIARLLILPPYNLRIVKEGSDNFVTGAKATRFLKWDKGKVAGMKWYMNSTTCDPPLLPGERKRAGSDPATSILSNTFAGIEKQWLIPDEYGVPNRAGSVSVRMEGDDAEHCFRTHDLLNYGKPKVPKIKDTVKPVLTEYIPVPTPTDNNTPQYAFKNSDKNEGVSLTYGGPCSSPVEWGVGDAIIVTFSPLSPGTYDNCTITATDPAGNVSDPLSVSSFTILPPRDATPLTVSISPADRTTVTNTNTNIVLTFSEPIYKTDYTATFNNSTIKSIITLSSIQPAQFKRIKYSAKINDEKNVVTITPDDPLPNGNVSIYVSHTYYDAEGNQAEGGYVEGSQSFSAKAVFTVDTILATAAQDDTEESQDTTQESQATTLPTPEDLRPQRVETAVDENSQNPYRYLFTWQEAPTGDNGYRVILYTQENCGGNPPPLSSKQDTRRRFTSKSVRKSYRVQLTPLNAPDTVLQDTGCLSFDTTLLQKFFNFLTSTACKVPLVNSLCPDDKSPPDAEVTTEPTVAPPADDAQTSASGTCTTTTPACTFFNKYINIFRRSDVHEHFPEVLEAFKDDEDQPFFNSTVLGQFVERPIFIRRYVESTDDSIIILLALNETFWEMFRDRTFHSIVQSDGYLDELISYIRGTAQGSTAPQTASTADISCDRAVSVDTAKIKDNTYINSNDFICAVFQKHYNVFRRSDVNEHLPPVLEAFKNPRKAVFLDPTLIKLLADTGGYVYRLYADTDESIAGLLIVNADLKALFKDKHFHYLISPDAVSAADRGGGPGASDRTTKFITLIQNIPAGDIKTASLFNPTPVGLSRECTSGARYCNIFRRYYAVFNRTDVSTHFPPVLEAFKDPRKAVFLNPVLIERMANASGYVYGLYADTDESFAGLLVVNRDFKALFKDKEFHRLVRSPNRREIDALADYIRGTP